MLLFRPKIDRSVSEDQERSRNEHRKSDCRHPNTRVTRTDEWRRDDSESISGSSEWHRDQVSNGRNKKYRYSDDKTEAEKERKLKSRLSRVLSWL